MKRMITGIAVFFTAILTSLPAIAGDGDIPDEFFAKLFANAKFAGDPMFAFLAAGLVCALYAFWPGSKDSRSFGSLIGGLLLAVAVALACPALEIPMTAVGVLAGIIGFGGLASQGCFQGLSLNTLYTNKGDKNDDEEEGEEEEEEEEEEGEKSSLKPCRKCRKKTKGAKFCLECGTPRRARDDDEPPPRRRARNPPDPRPQDPKPQPPAPKLKRGIPGIDY